MADRIRVTLLAEDLKKLRELGGDLKVHISAALEDYLRRWQQGPTGQALPFETGTGWLTNILNRFSHKAVIEIQWPIPDHIRVALAWGEGIENHARKAIREYLTEHWSAAVRRKVSQRTGEND